MSRVVSVVMVLVVASCSARARVAGGAITTVAGGVLLVASNRSDGGCDDLFGCDRDDAGLAGPGVTMLAAGVVLMLIGLATDDEVTPAPAIATVPSRYLLDVSTPLPADFAMRSRLENQLAIQASTAARLGHCVAALMSGRRLAEIDAELYRKLVAADAAYSGCLAAAVRPCGGVLPLRGRQPVIAHVI